jgi:integrase
MASIKKVTPTQGPKACRPKTGRLFCVLGRHVDNTLVHRHFPREDQAKDLVRRLGAEHVGGQRVGSRPSNVMFQSYAEEWRDAQVHQEPDVVRYALKRSYPLMGKVRMVNLTGLKLQKLRQQLLDSYARSTTDLTMVYVVAVCRQAVADGVCPVDPTERLPKLRRNPHETVGVVTKDMVPSQSEAVAILAATPTSSRYTQSTPRYRLGMTLGFGCGLRVGEILGLRPMDVGPGCETISVVQQYQRRGMVAPKTWRGVRTIEVPGLVSVELRRALRDDPPPDKPFLVGPRGATIRRDGWYEQAWRPALVGAGLAGDRYKFHSTRHYTVSSMLLRNVPLPEIAEYVGDTIETITAVYAKFLNDAPRTARAALDQALAPVEEEPPSASEDTSL